MKIYKIIPLDVGKDHVSTDAFKMQKIICTNKTTVDVQTPRGRRGVDGSTPRTLGSRWAVLHLWR